MRQQLPVLFIGGMVLLVLFLSVAHDLFHNHAADLMTHTDCPVYDLLLVLTTVLVIFWAVWLFFSQSVSTPLLVSTTLVQQRFGKIDVIRGPPLFCHIAQH